MPNLPITALYASLLSLIILWLSFNVVRFRRKEKVGLGDGGHRQGQKVIRAQANTLEYIPMILVLFVIAEINGAASWLLHLLGLSLLVARIIYPLGIMKTSGTSFGRFYGTLITWLVLIVLALLNIFYGIQSL